MKTMITSLALMLLTSTAVQAQDPTMEESLKTTFTQFDTTMSMSSMMPLSAQFDLIANKYSKEWVAQYYAAYAKVNITYFEPDVKRKDLLLDEADMYLQRITDMGVSNDEVYILTAMIANARLAVDPQNRYKKYGQIFEENLDKAKAVNATNPRYYYMKGVAKYYTPKMFGGGGEAARPYLDKAKELYAKEDKATVLKPYWGEPQTDYHLAEIAKTDKKGKKSKKD